MFRLILFLAIIRLDAIIGENYTIYNMTQYNHQYHIPYCAVFSDNCIQPDGGQK